MSGGYTASTDAMATASKKITQLAEDLPDKNTDLAHTPVNAQAVSGYSNTLNTFGTNIGTGGKSYAATDHAQSGAITSAGSQ
jgi:hypothetical protein